MSVQSKCLAVIPSELVESDFGMSNCDHTIDDELENDLRSGKRAQHSAWDFCGYVWFDANINMFCEEVWVYHSHAETIHASTLEDLMDEVNSKYGAN